MDKVFPEPARLGLTQGRNNLSHTSPDMKEQEARGGWQGKGWEHEVQQEGQGGTEPRAQWLHPSPADISPPAAPQGGGNPTWSRDGHQAGGPTGCAPQGENPWVQTRVLTGRKRERNCF